MLFRKHALFVSCVSSLFASLLVAQGGAGAIDLNARITATGGRPEPVRDFTFYVLTKSYAEIVKEVEAQDVLPTREEFIESLKVSPQLKSWMKEHDVLDLAQIDLDKMVTADNILQIPEFLAAYQRSNSGGVTAGLPNPKFKDADRETNPAKYEKQKQEYLIALKKFIQSNPSTVSGIELELGTVNPKTQWDKIHFEHRKKIAQMAPDTAQAKYLAGKVDTDLEGRAFVSGIPAGTYWVSTLGTDASSGDRRFRWNLPAKVESGRTTRVDLTNVNGIDANANQP